MKKLISTLGMPREEWLQYRKQGIGGSDAGAICGLNPYSSAMSVYRDKVSSELSDVDNESMHQGHELEAYVARRFSEAARPDLYREFTRLYIHGDLRLQLHKEARE